MSTGLGESWDLQQVVEHIVSWVAEINSVSSGSEDSSMESCVLG